MHILVSTGIGIVAIFIVLRLLYWYFNATVCIACYDTVRIRQAKSAGHRNRDMYLCKECNG